MYLMLCSVQAASDIIFLCQNMRYPLKDYTLQIYNCFYFSVDCVQNVSSWQVTVRNNHGITSIRPVPPFNNWEGTWSGTWLEARTRRTETGDWRKWYCSWFSITSLQVMRADSHNKYSFWLHKCSGCKCKGYMLNCYLDNVHRLPDLPLFCI